MDVEGWLWAERVWREITEACNGDLVFIAFRMMTPLNSHPSPFHLTLFPMPSGMGKRQRARWTNVPWGSSGSNDQGDSKETSRAGGGRNTLASYSACHSNWQQQPALLLAVGPHRASASLQWDLCLILMAGGSRAFGPFGLLDFLLAE